MDKVIQIVSKFCSSDGVVNEDELRNDLGLDSIDYIELIMAIEDEFAVKVTDEEGFGWVTVQDIIDYVK